MSSALTAAKERVRACRNRLIWLIFKGVLFLSLVLGVVFLAWLLLSDFPLIKKEERKNPLTAPITINRIEGTQIHTSQGSFKLAGVKFPTDSVSLEKANQFLKIATAQGIEVIRQVNNETAILRCEPRIYHWCGNDPVSAHYEQHNLNELLIALGYATFDTEADGLTEKEKQRFNAATQVAAGRSDQAEEKLSTNSIREGNISSVNVAIQIALNKQMREQR
jgi:hypothetical protein